jgi:hypothetical protein
LCGKCGIRGDVLTQLRSNFAIFSRKSAAGPLRDYNALRMAKAIGV